MGKLITFTLTIAFASSITTILAAITPIGADIGGERARPAVRLSRQIDAQSYDGYIAEMSETFRITLKGKDPFGNNQDLSTKQPLNIVKSVAEPTENRIALGDIVKRLKVNMIQSGAKKIIVGRETYNQGDDLPISVGGKLLQLQLIGVTSGKLTFRSRESGEIVELPARKTLVGITPTKKGEMPPGLSSKKRPISLDLDEVETAP
jgi:hypothetical protein